MKNLSADARLILLLGAIVAALFLKALPLTLPEVRAINAPYEFDTTGAIARLARILGDERPHPVDTDANDAVRARLIAEIEALGYKPETRDDFTCRPMADRNRAVCARVRNIVFRAGPAEGRAVMLAAHYDSVPAGPGAGDDGIGVAVSLEVARILALEPPAKPVFFLMTDGEELGLLGAHSFVNTDPLADEIDAVINLEARGVRGPAQMFETSIPNGVDVEAFAKGAKRPFANSMMTDIYRLLPNDTDMTEFLPKGYQALNLALTEGVEFYHTPHDKLANLDPRSVQHIGDLALNSLRNLLALEKKTGEPQLIFSDILSRATILLPQWLGGVILVVAAVLALVSFARRRSGRPIRTMLAPLAALILAGGLAFGLQLLIGAVRPEAAYWSAHPQAMQAIAYLAAACAMLAAFATAGAVRERLIDASWFWFAFLGAAGYALAPGASILFVLPLLVYTAGAIASLAVPSVKAPMSIAAAALALIVLAPAIHLAEIGLGYGTIAIFAVVAALVMIVAAPVVLRETSNIAVAPIAASGFLLFLAVGVALALPAYSAKKPQPLNVQLVIDAGTREATWLLGVAAGEPAPKIMAAAAPFERRDIEGLGKGRLAAPAPDPGTPAADIAILSDQPGDAGRRVRFALSLNGSDVMFVRIPEAAGAAGFLQSGRKGVLGEKGDQFLYCVGRACDGAEFEVDLRGAEATDWLVFGLRFGLPDEASELVAARPDWATPIQNGDVIITRLRKSV